jgi:hypothetical protein
MESSSTGKIAVHMSPIWRHKADFIIRAHLDGTGSDDEWEQLWARRVDQNLFEICCIPFFVYDIALGDVVSTTAIKEVQFAVEEVVNPSGHYTFRVWFKEANPQKLRVEIIESLNRMECGIEWSSTHLLAIDTPTDVSAQAAADYLRDKQASGLILYESGRTR